MRMRTSSAALVVPFVDSVVAFCLDALAQIARDQGCPLGRDRRSRSVAVIQYGVDFRIVMSAAQVK